MSKAWDDLQAIMYFQQGTGNDPKGRRLRDYRNFTDAQMESEHDFIQYMFPTDQVSRFNPDAWLLQTEPDPFGMRECAAPVMRSVIQYLGYLTRNDKWRTPDNHNILRVSRMLRSVKLICGDAAAFDLLCIVCVTSNVLSESGIEYPIYVVNAGNGTIVLDHWLGAVLDGSSETGQMARRAWRRSDLPDLKSFLEDFNKGKEAA